MKKRMLYISTLVLPFLGMIAVNEYVRINRAEGGYTRQAITAVNSANKLKDRCTWVCHDDTEYCKANHVKFAMPYFDKIDPVYFGIINSLKSTGDYGLANIIFLVILIPLIMYFLLVKSISMQLEIRKIRRE